MFQVVIATNVANQAVTLPGVKFVWDFCLTKFPRLDWTNGVERLDTRLCSDLEKVQRAGRAARKSPGTCIEFVEKENKLENHFYNIFCCIVICIILGISFTWVSRKLLKTKHWLDGF